MGAPRRSSGCCAAADAAAAAILVAGPHRLPQDPSSHQSEDRLVARRAIAWLTFQVAAAAAKPGRLVPMAARPWLLCGDFSLARLFRSRLSLQITTDELDLHF